ncbi:hypothetical protein HOS22_gp09 [Rhizobium phage RHEph08]|uniref:Uncharacterized protein n=2 Tax=Cuernavacavirus TaxID=2731935 RepID=L7TK78_9CAUD|nr:hypothetical protein HOS22_gp09 [Rhizobium phage RHEph08]YP_009793248.1 hypothetical protein HOS23_gp06 [Rhizobium phage RHEph09]AGC35933.1 hypothetical protein RHEph08_gp009 [Rhizobium phage RHEph08]AGC35989.1 hypothetical protein RHEph09_gp006 [Rhizobium phage RHEph09]
MIQHATKSLKQAQHKGRMNARKAQYIQRLMNIGLDIIYPSRADAKMMHHLNRKHRRQLASTRYRKMMKAFITA